MTADLDDDCARVLDKVLRWIDADDIWGIISNNTGGTVSVAYKVFEGVEYAVPDDRREVRVELPDIIRNKAFRESMNHIVKDVIRAVRKHNGRRNQRMSGEVCLGRLRGDLIEDMTEVWFWEKNRPPEPEPDHEDRRDRSRRDRGREGSDDGTDKPDVVEAGDKPEEPVPEEKPKRTRRSRKDETAQGIKDEPAPRVESVEEKPKRSRKSRKEEPAPETKVEEPAPEVATEEEKPKRSRRSKKTEESVPETKVEEPVREEKPEKNPGGSGSDDPQASFLKAVTPMQREYIGMILANEDTTEFLKAKRKSVKWMETALNNVAGKTLGENVVLDGRPVDKWKPLLGKVKRS